MELNPSRNDITGDKIRTRGMTVEYRENWDRIFGKKDKVPEDSPAPDESKEDENL